MGQKILTLECLVETKDYIRFLETGLFKYVQYDLLLPPDIRLLKVESLPRLLLLLRDYLF